MSSAHDQPFGAKRVVGEFVLIFASVLVALGAQAMWQDHRDHAAEQDYLRALLSDARANQGTIRKAIHEDSVSLTRAEHLEKALRSGDRLSPDSMRSWLRVSYSDFYPVTGTLTALVGSGDIRLIRSDSIRYAARQLASEFEGAFDDLRATTQAAWNVPLVDVIAAHRVQNGYDVPALQKDPLLYKVGLIDMGIGNTRLGALVRLDSANDRLVRLIGASYK